VSDETPTSRSTETDTRWVTLGRLDGSLCTGRGCFDPAASELVVRPAEGEAGVVPAEQIAWVGFGRETGPTRRTPAPTPDAPIFRIRVTGGRSFLVQTPPGAVDDPLGFFAVPVDADEPFAELWFYAHGVNIRELDEPLGELLLRGGALTPGDLSRGLEAQAEGNPPRPRLGEILVGDHKVAPEDVERGISLQQRARLRIGDLLVEEGLASRRDVETALERQRQHGGRRLGRILVEMGVLSERRLAETLARKFRLVFADLDALSPDPRAADEVPRWVIEKHRLLPLSSNISTLTVAVGDPLDTEGIDLLRFHTDKAIREVVVVPSQLERTIEKRFGGDPQGAERLEGLLEELPPGSDETGEREADAELDESDSTIIRLAHRLLAEGHREGASDIHVEPNGPRRRTLVRLRVDGECRVCQEIPPAYRKPLVSRLKIMAGLDIAERRRPQDGRIRLRMAGHPVEYRVVTLPTTGGEEDVVLRILASQEPPPLEALHLRAAHREALERLVAQPHGMILCVGPTGSGKTTTLHSLLRTINDPTRKIWTAEDPVEITQAGLRQVQVHPRIGLTFAALLRSFLRADPDVIMVGEMRDRETADIAVEASLTGHLVLSTLHTNSAPETVVRLVEMGIDPFAFGDSLLGVLAQRLARALCPECREPREANDAECKRLEELGAPERAPETRPRLWSGRGCGACRGTGYRGRVALHELLVADDVVRAAIRRRAGADEVRALGRERGMRSLLEDGLAKCLEGTTDLPQVLAVCSS